MNCMREDGSSESNESEKSEPPCENKSLQAVNYTQGLISAGWGGGDDRKISLRDAYLNPWSYYGAQLPDLPFLFHSNKSYFSIYMFFLASFQLCALKLNVILCAHANAVRLNAQFSSLQALCQEEKSSPAGRAGPGPAQHLGVRTAALLRQMWLWLRH